MRALLFTVLSVLVVSAQAAVRLKEIGRFEGVQENVAVGYGLVVGLAGTGDSPRSIATQQSVSNMLREFGLNISPGSIAARNVAAVMVTTSLPAFLRAGDRLDVNVASLGDATNLSGGTLLLTQLMAADRKLYAVAQGPLSVGGYRVEQNGTLRQKNHPTSGTIPEGAIAQRSLSPSIVGEGGRLELILNRPDFVTAQRVAGAINKGVTDVRADAIDAGRIQVTPAGSASAARDFVSLVAAIESLLVEPDEKAVVVVNERTGTIVSGGQVTLSAVTVTQGDIRVAITQRYLVSQPGAPLIGSNPGVQTAIVPESTIDVDESALQSVTLKQGATIGELVSALRAIRASSRDVIAILQGIKRAGSLHAELVIQ